MSQHQDAYIYSVTPKPKQRLKLNSWENEATLRLSWKNALLIKKSVWSNFWYAKVCIYILKVYSIHYTLGQC